MHLDLTDLRLFLMVAEAGSITEGGARAGLALASASARIRGMEEQAGVRLLARGRRGITPTPAGLALLRHARLVTQQIERMNGEMGAYGRGLTGHIRILANTAASAEILPALLARFLVSHPNVDVELLDRPSPAVAQAVAEDRAHLGIVADHADLTGLESFPFRLDRLVLAVPGGHDLAGRAVIAFAETFSHPFIGLAEDSALQLHLAGHAVRAGGGMRVRARAPSLDAVCCMVAAGAGVAVIPEIAARS